MKLTLDNLQYQDLILEAPPRIAEIVVALLKVSLCNDDVNIGY